MRFSRPQCPVNTTNNRQWSKFVTNIFPNNCIRTGANFFIHVSSNVHRTERKLNVNVPRWSRNWSELKPDSQSSIFSGRNTYSNKLSVSSEAGEKEWRRHRRNGTKKVNELFLFERRHLTREDPNAEARQRNVREESSLTVFLGALSHSRVSSQSCFLSSESRPRLCSVFLLIPFLSITTRSPCPAPCSA